MGSFSSFFIDVFSSILSFLVLIKDYVIGLLLGVYQLSWSLLHAAWTGVASAVIAVWNWLSGGVVFVGAKGIEGVSGVGDFIVSGAAFLVELVMSIFRGFGG